MAEPNPNKAPIYAGDWSASAGKPYAPSNGTEGDIFTSMWCAACKHEAAFHRDPDGIGDTCDIAMRAYFVRPTDPDYPKEWRRDDQGVPECTAWEADDARPEMRP